jgi:hypothetical protein
MKKDTLYGPPKELFEVSESVVKKKKKNRGDEAYIHVDVDTSVFDQNQLRKYELNKMKYFYAVIHCNTRHTAERIYNDYNDYEFELSNIRLNLSFISEDLIFPQKPKEQATEVPAEYEFKGANSLNRALNHTEVKLTWDETDPKRLKKFQKIMEADPDKLDEDAYKDFLASGTEDEAELMKDDIAND